VLRCSTDFNGYLDPMKTFIVRAYRVGSLPGRVLDAFGGVLRIVAHR